MPRLGLPLPRCFLSALSHSHAPSHPRKGFHQYQQRRSAIMPGFTTPLPRTIKPDPNHHHPQYHPIVKPWPSLCDNTDLHVCAVPASPPNPDGNDGLPPDLQEKLVSLDYALSVLRSLMTNAEKDRDNHGLSLGPLSNKGTTAMQKNSDELDCIEMTSMIVHRAKSIWKPTEADDIREMYMKEKRMKERMGRGNSSDRLLEELLVHDIARRIAPFYELEAENPWINLHGQFPDFGMIRNAIWPAYEAARQRQGFKELDDLTTYEKSMMDFYV